MLLVFLFYLSAFAQLEFSDTYFGIKRSTEYISKQSKGVSISSILDSIITQYITSENIPGATGLIFNRYGDVTWSGNYGFRNIEQQLPVEDSTLFFMGSISKTFVATAIMQLWENGLIDLRRKYQ